MEWRLAFAGVLIHGVLIYSIFDIYYTSPIVTDVPAHEITNNNAPAKRLVVISADGLRLDTFYQHSERSPFLHSLIKEHKGIYATSRSHVPTESRPGHIAIFAGFTEDVSARFFEEAKNDSDLLSRLMSNKRVFFLHLLGLDTNGHGNKPHSEEYLSNIEVVDHGIERLQRVFHDFFNDQYTAWVFTADHGMTDWGSHGAGSDEEIDLAPLFACLIGVPVPINSMGILPLHVLDVPPQYLYKSSFSNFLQLKEQFMVLRTRKARRLFFKDFYQFGLHSLKSLEAQLIRLGKLRYVLGRRFSAASTLFVENAPYIRMGILYFHRYDRFFLGAGVDLFIHGFDINFAAVGQKIMGLLFVPYSLLSIAYESIFILCFLPLLVMFLRFEFDHLSDIEFLLLPNNCHLLSEDSVLRPGQVTMIELRRAALCLSFVLSTLFGTGNFASMNSFNPSTLSRFISVFSPFTMAALLLFKLFIPLLMVSLILAAVLRFNRETIKRFSCLVLIHTDLMAMCFFYLLKDDGSWLDIGLSISHYLISMFMSVALLLLLICSSNLMTISLSIDDLQIRTTSSIKNSRYFP
ncbi:hypothetical protein DICVIV_01362 [Dictyocaulus viviparus]|uniref:GPI ethanolamine phosphate transferase 1 n=1 Tax=Dictyocaulus viviparus TaxID=29172 RepID=A0A0D8Y6N5_DICVI|nr:hypothetical protein DICVIV_01362 [Dictyocaulus viviparus]